jgi:hypothetical protein
MQALRPARLYCILLIVTNSIKQIPKKRGRPATGKNPAVVVRFPPAIIGTIDEWAASTGDGVSRSEAIRRLVDLGLAKGKAR